METRSTTEIKSTLEVKKISENLTHTVSISSNNETLYLEINYMNGKYKIEKSFQNNYYGKRDMKEAVNNFNTEEKVKKYLKV